MHTNIVNLFRSVKTYKLLCNRQKQWQECTIRWLTAITISNGYLYTLTGDWYSWTILILEKALTKILYHHKNKNAKELAEKFDLTNAQPVFSQHRRAHNDVHRLQHRLVPRIYSAKVNKLFAFEPQVGQRCVTSGITAAKETRPKQLCLWKTFCAGVTHKYHGKSTKSSLHI